MKTIINYLAGVIMTLYEFIQYLITGELPTVEKEGRS
jgi:hypothetical protein